MAQIIAEKEEKIIADCTFEPKTLSSQNSTQVDSRYWDLNEKLIRDRKTHVEYVRDLILQGKDPFYDPDQTFRPQVNQIP